MRYKILAVDDEPANLMLLREVLQDEYDMVFAKNGNDALKRIPQNPDLILLDIMMPEMDGYEVCQRLKLDPASEKIPVIFLTAKIGVQDEVRGFELGAVDYITKPISPPVLRKRVETQLNMYNQKRLLESLVAERTAELHSTRLEVIQRLGKAAEFKDNETGMHVIRMSHFSKLLAEKIGLPAHECDLILNAAPMHDIGKIGIPDAILLKPGKLDPDEWKIMQTHPALGAEIIGENSSSLLTMARDIALTHHEKWDGSGYPQGLKGKEIPIASRIIAIADVFDALTTERPYKKAWPVEEAIALLKDQTGKHFDPALVPIFIDAMPEVLAIKERYKETLT